MSRHALHIVVPELLHLHAKVAASLYQICCIHVLELLYLHTRVAASSYQNCSIRVPLVIEIGAHRIG